ncbi:putative effector [Erysiphe necator]|uniref:Putative effector n=1 Tax=Uncinula necator TaxID=52586 RepID=A0A0B1P3M5_UNCNE|nr:putative effector [Erysiphe necator]
MFAAVCTRPDIAFHLGRLSQQLQDPVERHDSGIKEIGRYLSSTIKQKIRFGPPSTHTVVNRISDPSSSLKLYSDADWAYMEVRKSISRYAAILNGGPVSWGRLWLAQALRDMGFLEYVGKDHRLVDMRADNQGAIALVRNPHLHERSKHIDIFYHFIRDIEAQKLLHMTSEPTGQMIADGFTKPLDKTMFQKFKAMMGFSGENYLIEVQSEFSRSLMAVLNGANS